MKLLTTIFMLDTKKAIISGVIFYAMIFLATSIIMFVLGIMEGIVFHTLTWIVIALTTYFLASKYYFIKKVKEPVKEGLLYGIAVAVVSTLFDIPVMVYGFASDVGIAWFYQWELWFGSLVVIAVSIYVATRK
jgi:hypothetical protein